MIALLWSAKATPTEGPAYAAHFKNFVLPAVRSIDGYAGAMLLERQADETVEIVVISWWSSLEAIQEFAGADLEEAVVADEASALLTSFDRRVRHYQLAVRDDRSADHTPALQ